MKNIYRILFIILGVIFALAGIAVLALFPALAVWLRAVVCCVCLGIAVVFILASTVGYRHIEKVDAKVKQKTFFIKNLQTDVELLATAESDLAAKNAFNTLAEHLRFSDPMSDASLADLEQEITNKIGALKGAEDKTASAVEIIYLLDERNRKCKILK